RSESNGYVFSQEEVIPLVGSLEPRSQNSLIVPIQVIGTNVGEIQLTDDVDRKWSTADAEIIDATMLRVGQHIENLRLLAQAEKYRQEAEQVSRRLTREGWGTYLQTRSTLASGYSYNLNEVTPFETVVESNHFLSQPITVHDETIGELLINDDHADS